MNFGTQRASPEKSTPPSQETKKDEKPLYKSVEERAEAEKARFYANNQGAYNPEAGVGDFIGQMKTQMDKTFREATAVNKKIFGENAFTTPNPDETFEAFKDRMKREADASRGGASYSDNNRNSQQQNNSFSNGGNEQRHEREPVVKTFESVGRGELGITESESEAIFRKDFFIPDEQIILLAKKIFGVADGKDKESIKRVYKSRASEFHPDSQTNQEASEEKKKINEYKFTLVSTFYNKYKNRIFS